MWQHDLCASACAMVERMSVWVWLVKGRCPLRQAGGMLVQIPSTSDAVDDRGRLYKVSSRSYTYMTSMAERRHESQSRSVPLLACSRPHGPGVQCVHWRPLPLLPALLSPPQLQSRGMPPSSLLSPQLVHSFHHSWDATLMSLAWMSSQPRGRSL